MGSPSNQEHALELSEILLAAVALAMHLLLVATAISALYGGPHRATTMLFDGAWYWIPLAYVATCAVFASVSAMLVLPLARRFGRAVGTMPLWLALGLPVVNGLLTTQRPLEVMLRAPSGLAMAGLGLAVLAVALVLVVRLGNSATKRAVSLLLLMTVLVTAAANSLNLFVLSSRMVSLEGLLAWVPVAVGMASLGIPVGWVITAEKATPKLGLAIALYSLGFFAVVSGSAAMTKSSKAQTSDPRTNVLFIVLDTLRADHVEGFGGEEGRTPELRRLGDEGIRFTKAYSMAPWTTPSVATMLTSTYPSDHGAGRKDPTWGYKYPMVDSVPTLAKALVDEGYFVGGTLTNNYLGTRYGVGRDFDVWENLSGAEDIHPLLLGLAGRGLFTVAPYFEAEVQTDRALELVARAQASGKPWFTLVHYMDAHIPSDVPPGYEGPPLTTFADLYRAEISYMDSEVGRLLETLRAEGLYEDLLLVLVSDHGEQLDEPREGHNHLHGHTLYDELLHVPLIIKPPRWFNGGDRVEVPVSTLDLGPTILGELEISEPESFQGLDLLQDSLDPERLLYAEANLYNAPLTSARAGTAKVIAPASVQLEDVEAYDLSVDPGERRPLDPSEPPFTVLTENVRSYAGREVQHEDSEPIQLDGNDRQALEALGYLNSEPAQ